MKRKYTVRRADGQLEERTDHAIDDTGGFNFYQELAKKAKVTPHGREYVAQHDYFETLDQAAQAANYTREGEAERLAADELHMMWALQQDPEMSTEDYLYNLNNIPNWGPSKPKEQLAHPATRVKTRWDK